MHRFGSPRPALTVLVLGAIAAVPTEALARQTPVQGLPLAMRHSGPEDAPTRDVGSPPAAEPVAPVSPEPTPSPTTPDAPTDATATVPEAPAAEASVPEAPASETREPTAPSTSEQAEPPAEVAPTLLEANPEPAAPEPRRPVIVESEDPDAQDAALRRAYADRYRPAGNPTKANVVVRGMFTNMGGRDGVGGRMGGARVDVGPAWNHVAVAATFSAWGGKVLLPRDTGAEMNGLLGIGPTLGLGRLALLGRGFLDLRAGYDFMYGIVNQRGDQAVILQSQSDPSVVLTQTENLLPHGPRVTLDLGLLSVDRRDSRYFHGAGASMGWQALVHSFRGDLPVTNMLTMGLVYWFG